MAPIIAIFSMVAINLCVLCVFVVRSIRSPAGLYLRIHSNPREPSAFFSLLPLTPNPDLDKKNWSERFSLPQCCHGIQFCI
ncbi:MULTISPECIES: hypothetical protein [unclassified Microcystis]|uniref:hypothetical protein n=1 Tax=unclassified Microcystis TaxID=2643300 RepID=UPI00387E50D9